MAAATLALFAVTGIAVLGTGTMGAAIARRLLDAGHRVAVWNRTPEKAAALAARGARLATTPAAAVTGANLVIVMLTDAAAVERVLGEAAPALAADAVVAQMSTIGPDEVRSLADRVPARLLDAPVGGSVSAAETGTLTIFAGGPRAVVDAAEPLLSQLGTIRHCGEIGAAAATKLVVNTAMLTALGALHDALAVADAVGVDRKAALDLLAAGPLAGAVARAAASPAPGGAVASAGAVGGAVASAGAAGAVGGAVASAGAAGAVARAGADFAVSLAAKDLTLALRDTADTPVAAGTLRLLRHLEDQRADVGTLIRRETP